MDSNTVIRGYAVLTYGEEFSFWFGGNRNLKRLGIALIFCMLLFLGADYFFVQSGNLRMMAIYLILAFGGGISMVAVFQAIIFSKLSEEQRRLSWEITTEAVLVSDASGAMVKVPWIQVKTAYERPALFGLICRPYGVRNLPKRAFSDEDVDRIRALISKKFP